jgi:hypothetical protein
MSAIIKLTKDSRNDRFKSQQKAVCIKSLRVMIGFSLCVSFLLLTGGTLKAATTPELSISQLSIINKSEKRLTQKSSV